MVIELSSIASGKRENVNQRTIAVRQWMRVNESRENWSK